MANIIRLPGQAVNLQNRHFFDGKNVFFVKLPKGDGLFLSFAAPSPPAELNCSQVVVPFFFITW
jgi:hypothetical protein